MAKLKKFSQQGPVVVVSVPVPLPDDVTDDQSATKGKGLHPETLKSLARFVELGEIKNSTT